MSEIRVVLCTFPDAETAERIGRELVERRLVACVNLVAGVKSLYRWQGSIKSDSELLAICKTTAGALAELESALTALHPYEVPEIVSLDPTRVNHPYAAWVNAAVGQADPHADQGN